jgi:chorismate mutase
MNDRPFFWFLLNEPPQPDLFQEFKEFGISYSGIAINAKAYARTKIEVLKINRQNYKIPIALYWNYDVDIEPNLIDYVDKNIYEYNPEKIKKDFPDNNSLMRFEINLPTSSLIDGLVNQMSDYFLFKGLNPSIEVIVDFDPAIIKILPDFFVLMMKLGVQNFMVRYSIFNGNLINDCLSRLQDEFKMLNKSEPDSFDEWRNEIDELDRTIIESIRKRIQVVSKMGEFKKQNNMPLFEADRWNEILKSRKDLALSLGVDEELTGKIFESIHLTAIKQMLQIIMKKQNK